MHTDYQNLRFARWALLVLSLFVGGTSPVWAHGAGSHHAHSPSNQGYVTAQSLNVRSGPGTQYRRVGVLRQGEPVDIVSRSGNWYQIRGSHGTGWVSRSYISIAQAPVYRNEHRRSYRTHRPRRHFAVIAPHRYGFVNMFEGPGRRYHIKAQLPAGERVRVLEYGRRWTLVGKRGLGRGYVRSRFLERY